MGHNNRWHLAKRFKQFALQYDRMPTYAEARAIFPGAPARDIDGGLARALRDVLGQKRRLKKRERAITGKRVPNAFYDSERWRRLRFDVLKRDGARCVLCGRSAVHGVVLQVDHIQPRSLRPDLEWDPDNLQVLCQDCNLGKSNRDSTDFR